MIGYPPRAEAVALPERTRAGRELRPVDTAVGGGKLELIAALHGADLGAAARVMVTRQLFRASQGARLLSDGVSDGGAAGWWQWPGRATAAAGSKMTATVAIARPPLLLPRGALLVRLLVVAVCIPLQCLPCACQAP